MDMKRATYISGKFVVTLLIFISTGLSAEQPHGTVKAGYTFTDEVGNYSVYQPTYNLYDGVGLSLEDFTYRLENGTKLFGDFQNVTLNNRRMYFGGSKTSLFNVRFAHNQYRRNYSFAGDKSTRRDNSSGNLWVQAHKNVRLFGGYGRIAKSGELLSLMEPTTGIIGATDYDYKQKYYNAGARFNYEGSYVEVELRGSDFDDELNVSSQRSTKQFRITGSSPLPEIKNLYVNGGFQRFQLEVNDINDSMIANTGWGGLRYYHKSGLFAKYSFIWDRARRTTDLIATDNITNAFYVGKSWQGRGGLTVGFRHRINDDVLDEKSTKGYLLSCWLKATRRLTLRGGFGSENTEVESGMTLTGDKDFTRYKISTAYKFKQGTWRTQFQNKKTENNNIGSTAEFIKLGTDITIAYEKYGELMAAYDYLDGEYVNAEGTFNFNDHVFWGDLLTRRYKNYQLGCGGTYVRSRQDVDIESFSVRFSGNYLYQQLYKFEIIYTAHNFDDFNDPSPVYSRYYTANIIEVILSREF